MIDVAKIATLRIYLVSDAKSGSVRPIFGRENAQLSFSRVKRPGVAGIFFGNQFLNQPQHFSFILCISTKNANKITKKFVQPPTIPFLLLAWRPG